jgi:hypothetical protein
MYQKDVTQNIEPAQPNYGTMAESIRLKGQATQGIVKAVGQMYETKKFIDLRDAEASAQDLQDEFLERGMGAQVAGRQAVQVDAMAEDLIGRTMADPNFDPAQVNVINNLKAEAERLKQASLGGMSNREYEDRVATLTKRTIAKYPGLANEIRQSIGAVAGLPGADRWAAQQYVQERFGKQAGGEGDRLQADFLKDSIKKISANTGMLETEVYAVFQQDPARYRQLETQTTERLANIQRTQMVDEQLKTNAAVGNLTAEELRPGISALFAGLTSDKLIGSVQLQIAQGGFTGYLEAAKTGKLDPAQFQMEADLFTSQMLSSAQSAYNESITSLNELRSIHGFDKEKYDDLKKGIDDQYTAQKEKWGDKNAYSAMAAVVARYGKETYQRQYDAYRVTLEEMRIYPPDVINSFLLNPEVLKAKLPAVYEHLSKVYNGQMNMRGELLSTVTQQKQDVDFFLRDVQRTGEAPQLPEEMPTQNKKVVVESVTAVGEAALDKAAKGAELTFQETQQLKAALDVSASGGNPASLNNNAPVLKQKITKLPEGLKAEAAAALSKGTVRTVTAINSALEGIRNKYGKTVFLGVNDAGMLLPLKEGGNVQLVGGRFVGGTGDPAAEEFSRVATPLLMNLVNARYLVDTRTKKEIAEEFARIINNGEPYTGFFTMDAKPTTPQPVQQGVPLGAPSTGPIKFEKDIPAAMKGGAADLVRERDRLAATLDDVKPGSPTYKRIEEDLKAMDSELSRMGVTR